MMQPRNDIPYYIALLHISKYLSYVISFTVHKFILKSYCGKCLSVLQYKVETDILVDCIIVLSTYHHCSEEVTLELDK